MGIGQPKGDGGFGRDFETDNELDRKKQLILPVQRHYAVLQ